MPDELVVVGIGERGEAQQARVVTELDGGLGLGYRLARRPADPGHEHAGAPRASRGRFGGELEHRTIEADAGVADGELRRVNADGQAARVRGEVVTGEGALAALVELSARRRGRADGPG